MKTLLVTFLMVCLSTAAFAKKVAKIKMMRGSVFAVKDGKKGPLKKDDWIEEGSTVETGAKSFAKLIFLDKSSMNVGPKSEIEVKVFQTKDRPGLINMVKGKIRAQVTKDYMRPAGKSKVVVKTPKTIMGIRGTDFQVDGNKLTLFEGRVDIAPINPGIPVDLAQMDGYIDANGTQVNPGEIANAGQGGSIQTRPASPQELQRANNELPPASGPDEPGPGQPQGPGSGQGSGSGQGGGDGQGDGQGGGDGQGDGQGGGDGKGNGQGGPGDNRQGDADGPKQGEQGAPGGGGPNNQNNTVGQNSGPGGPGEGPGRDGQIGSTTNAGGPGGPNGGPGFAGGPGGPDGGPGFAGGPGGPDGGPGFAGGPGGPDGGPGFAGGPGGPDGGQGFAGGPGGPDGGPGFAGGPGGPDGAAAASFRGDRAPASFAPPQGGFDPSAAFVPGLPVSSMIGTVDISAAGIEIDPNVVGPDGGAFIPPPPPGGDGLFLGGPDTGGPGGPGGFDGPKVGTTNDVFNGDFNAETDFGEITSGFVDNIADQNTSIQDNFTDQVESISNVKIRVNIGN